MSTTEEENWSSIPGHEDYVVNSMGGVMVYDTNQPVRVSKGATGLKVNLRDSHNRFTTKALGRIVAEAFVPRSSEWHDTVIHLDGDRGNCAASNLMWRSRSYAIRYHKQFHEEIIDAYILHPVVDDHDQEFRNIAEAAHTYGLLYRDILMSIIAEREVYLTGQRFYWLE